MTYCKLCGNELTEGKCTSNHEFKKMCVNCHFCRFNQETEEYLCENDENKKDALEKIKDAAKEVAGPYEVENLEIRPIALKKPYAKCKRWGLSNAVLQEIVESFV